LSKIRIVTPFLPPPLTEESTGMKKNIPNLEGISLGGISLDPNNLPITCVETTESIKEDLREIGKCVKKHTKAKYIPRTGRRGKHGPVRILSQDEINNIEFERKLQMAEKRRSERMIRALAFLFDETYGTGKLIGTAELAKHLNIPKSSSSSVMTAIDKKMGDVIEKIFDDKKILRRVIDDASFNSTREFVEEYYRRDGRKAKKKTKVIPKPTTEPEVKPDEIDEIDQKLSELEKEIREGVENIASMSSDALVKILNNVDRKIDLNLNVTGEVKFRFLFGENK
jgi:hypothetical protein